MQIEILTEKELCLLAQLIINAQNIVVCCHKSPDGDALGSSLAWAGFLQTQYSKQVSLIVPDAFPDFLKWMPNIEKVVRFDKYPKECKETFANANLVFCLDFNATSRVDDMQPLLDETPAKRVMIDHHLEPDMDTALTVSHPEASSTSELIFRIIWQMRGFGSMTKQQAVSIYCGMMTDTGGFTYNSSNPEIYFIIGELLTKGIDKDKIYRNVYHNYSSWAIRLRGYLMSQKLNVFEELHAAYFTISRKDMADYHFVKGDAEGLVNDPLQIKGLKLSISLREDDRKDNLIWISLRSVDDFPCNKVAQEFFNGGGHLNASGGKLFCSLAEAEQVVRRAIIHYENVLKQ